MTEEKVASLFASGRLWSTAAALACLELAAIAMNAAVFPAFDAVYAPARDLSVLANALFLLAVGALATFKPQVLHLKSFDVITFACLVGGALLLLPALQMGNAPLLVVASCVVSIGRAGSLLFVGLALLDLSRYQIWISVTVGFLAALVPVPLLSEAPAFVWALLYLVLPVIAFGLVFKGAQPLFDQASEGEPPAEVAIMRPATFLPLASQLFVCLLLFHAAFGFSLRFDEALRLPFADALLAVPLAAFLAYLVVSRKTPNDDVLARVSILCVIAGFFVVTSSNRVALVSSNVLLSAGNTLFDMVAWAVLAEIANRNRAGAVAVFSWGRGVCALGSIAGAALGVWCNSLIATSPDLLEFVSGVMLVAVVAYALLGLRTFSFSETVEHVDTGEGPAAAASPEDVFEARCAQVIEQYGLSKREGEVFRMLARGRDRAYVQEQLVISRNTVKAHVRHIYEKLGVHSHQDLIDLVQD
jgi:DNA-binding CsgD family transcriptional regulator